MTRHVVAFLVSIVVGLGCLTIAVGTQTIRDSELRGYVDPIQNKNLPYRELNRLGVNADLTQYLPDDLDQHLEWMQEANIRWVRQFIYWDDIEPRQGEYNWESIDSIVEAVAARPQLQLVPVFMNTPSWARRNKVKTAPPDDPQHFASFVGAFAQRYGTSIDHYQIWDEPNLDDAWGMSNPRPAEYAALLAEAYTAIHTNDPQAKVIAAALAPTTERSGANIADITYLQTLYQLDAQQYFDAAAAKPYGFDHPPDDRTVRFDTLNFSRIIALREVMVKHNDSQTPLWASNVGWNALPDNWSGDESIWGSVSQSQQSDYTRQAFQRAEREWAWLGGFILHHWQPDVPVTNPQWGFSVIQQDDTPSSLWQTLTALEPPAIPRNGLYHPRTTAASYSGLWTFSELGADIGWLETSDSRFDFDFYGESIALLLREGDYFAFLYPTVDDQPPNALPHDASGNAYIFLRSGTQQPELNLVTVAEELRQTPHTLETTADRGWDRWALAGFAVSDGDLAASYNQQIMLAWFAFCVVLCAAVISGMRINWQPSLDRLSFAWNSIDAAWQMIISVITSIALMIGMLLTWGDLYPSIFRRDAFQSIAGIVMSGGLIALQPGFALALVMSLALFWIIYHRLGLGIGLVILWAPFFLFPVELYQFAFPLAELILLITVAAGLLRLFAYWGRVRQTSASPFTFQPSFNLSVIDWWLLCWLTLGTISLLWAEYLPRALTEWRTLFLEPFLLYVIARVIQPDIQTLRRWLNYLLFAGFLVCGIGLTLFIQGEAVITAEAGARRLASVYGSPNNVGLLLGRCLPFALAFTLLPVDGRRRYLSIGLLVVFGITAILTQSIGTLIIGLPTGIAVVIIAHWKWRSVPYLVAAAIVGSFLLILAMNISPRFASLLDLSSGTNFMRLRVWESTIGILQQHPLTGLGLDQFLPVYSGHYIRPDAIFDPDLSHPHNVLLDFWVRLGIGGVGLIIGLMYILWCRFNVILSKQRNDPVYHAIAIGTCGSIAALVAHGLVDNSIYVNDLVIIFMLQLLLIQILSDHVTTEN